MATLLEYARIADKVYEPSPASIPDWSCPPGLAVDDRSVFEGGRLLTTGFQGRVFESGGSAGEVVIAFKGTVPRMASDLIADLTLALNAIPGQAHVALAKTEAWRRNYTSKPISLVGHSLGGALAQVVGYRLGIKFVTFNAPGMLEQNSGIIPYGLGRIVRALGGGHQDAGVNFRRSWDMVGNFSAPIGRRVEIPGETPGNRTGPLASHSISGFVTLIESKPDIKNKDPLRDPIP